MYCNPGKSAKRGNSVLPDFAGLSQQIWLKLGWKLLPGRFSISRLRREAVMSQPPYRALRIMLGFLSLLMAVGGVVLIFSGKPLILRLFLHPPEAEISTLLLFTLKEMGGFALMLSVLLFFAARDPQRNLAIVDALIVGLFILSVTPLLSHRMLDIQKIYPAHLIWGRSVVRLALAAVLFYLRPRERHWEPAGNF
jgi:hypothetical protein